MNIATIEDGLVRREINYFDGAAFARQIGMLPAAGGRGDRLVAAAFNASTRVRGWLPHPFGR